MKKFLAVLCALFFAVSLGFSPVCYAQQDDASLEVNRSKQCKELVEGAVAAGLGSDAAAALEKNSCMSYWGKTALVGGITGVAAIAVWNSCFCVVPAFLRNLRYFGGNDQFCWFCKIIAVIYNEGVRGATLFVYKLREQFLDLLSIGILFFIVFKVGKMVSGFKETGAAAFATELFKPLLRALFAFIILASITYIFEWIITPFLQLTEGLTATVFVEGEGGGLDNVKIERSTLLAHIPKSDEFEGGDILIPNSDYTDNQKAIDLKACEDISRLLTKKTKDANGQEQEDNRLVDIEPVSVDGETYKPLLGTDYRNNMLIKPLCYTSAHLITGMSAGLALVTSGFAYVGPGAVPSFYVITLGLMLFVSYFLVMLAVPFKMIDAVLRLIFVVLLSPILVVLWVFPATVAYTKKGWDMFLSSCVTLFALFFLTMLTINLLEYTLINNEQNADLIQYLVMGNAKEVVKMVYEGSSGLFITLAIGILCAKLVGLAPTLANALVGSSADLKVGDSLHKQITGLGTTLGSSAASVVGTLGGGPGGKVDKAIWERATTFFRK